MSIKVELVFRTKDGSVFLHKTETYMQDVPVIHDVVSFEKVGAFRCDGVHFEVMEIEREYEFEFGIHPPSQVAKRTTIYLNER